MVEFALQGKSICKECMYHDDHGKLGFVGVLIVIMVVVVVLVYAQAMSYAHLAGLHPIYGLCKFLQLWKETLSS
jgi:hypothetical protein